MIRASMTGVAYGELARAVSRAGDLGMLGIGSRPELLNATIAQRPALVSLSFGQIRTHDVQALQAGGIVVSAQVNRPQAALAAVAAGVDLIGLAPACYSARRP